MWIKGNVMESTEEVLKKTYNIFESYKKSPNIELSESYIVIASEYTKIAKKLLDCNIDLNKNDNSKYWGEILRTFSKSKEGTERFVGERVTLICIIAYEVLIQSGEDIAASIKDDAEKMVSNLKSFVYPGYDDIRVAINYYDKFWKFQLLNDRLENLYKEKVESDINAVLGFKESEISKIKEDIVKNKELLERVETNSGFTSLFSGFESYSENIKKKLFWVSWEVRGLKAAMISVPALGIWLAFSGGESVRIYFGLLSILIVIGVLLRFSARKEDQLEQVLSKIDSRTALAVFHKYQVKDMEDESEKIIAHEKFQNFIYTEIKTSEWHAPDIAESIAQIIKSGRK